MTHRCVSRLFVISGLIAVLFGLAQVALATGNGGACKMGIKQFNSTGPVDNRGQGGSPPVWVEIEGGCYGGCGQPPPGCTVTCEEYAFANIYDGSGALVGVAMDCRCVTRCPDPNGNPVVTNVQTDAGAVPCRTLKRRAPVGGGFQGTMCNRENCANPCAIIEDPNITHGEEDLDGDGHFWETRTMKCACP